MGKSRIESVLSKSTKGWWETPNSEWGYNFYSRDRGEVMSMLDYLVENVDQKWEELRPGLIEQHKLWPVTYKNPLEITATRVMSALKGERFVAQIMSDVIVTVHAVAFRDVVSQVRDLEPESAPYHLFRFNHHWGCCFPEEIARALKGYDWGQHELYIIKCLKEHEDRLRKLGQHPLIGIQPRPGKNVTDN